MCDYEDERLEGWTFISVPRGIPMTKTQELRAWVEKHQDVLADKTFEEIAELAIATGFDRGTVAMWLTSEKFKRGNA